MRVNGKHKNVILYIANSAIPSKTANSIHVMKMCEAFALQNYRTTLLVPHRKDPLLMINDPFTFYGVSQNFNIIKIQAIKKHPRGVFNYLFACLALYQAQKMQVCLIYTRDPVVALFSFIFRFPVILELHEAISNTTPSMKIFKTLNIYNNLRFLKLVVITKPVRQYYIQQGCPEGKILVLPDAVNFRPYEAMITPSGEKKRYNIGYVGSLYKGRGIELICELSKRNPDDDFYLYGGTPEETSIWKQKTVGQNNVYFYGHIPNSDVPSVLNNMDILLMPYQRVVAASGNRGDTSKGMSPLKMFEYMASGRPIISSNIEVLKEILVHEKNCLLVDPQDIEGWYNAILLLKYDRKLAYRLGKTAQEQAKKNYTWEKRVHRIMMTITNLDVM